MSFSSTDHSRHSSASEFQFDSYCIVKVRVVVLGGCEPSCALTVTVDTIGWVVTLNDADGPEQPVHKLSPTATNASRIVKPRRFFQPNTQMVRANMEPGSNGVVSRRDAVVVDVFMVSVVEVGPADRLTACGEKLHEAPAGRPEQLNETEELTAD